MARGYAFKAPVTFEQSNALYAHWYITIPQCELFWEIHSACCRGIFDWQDKQHLISQRFCSNTTPGRTIMAKMTFWHLPTWPFDLSPRADIWGVGPCSNLDWHTGSLVELMEVQEYTASWCFPSLFCPQMGPLTRNHAARFCCCYYCCCVCFFVCSAGIILVPVFIHVYSNMVVTVQAEIDLRIYRGNEGTALFFRGGGYGWGCWDHGIEGS